MADPQPVKEPIAFLSEIDSLIYKNAALSTTPSLSVFESLKLIPLRSITYDKTYRFHKSVLVLLGYFIKPSKKTTWQNDLLSRNGINIEEGFFHVKFSQLGAMIDECFYDSYEDIEFETKIVVLDDLDNSPVAGASVVIGSVEVIADTNGVAIFSLKNDDYSAVINAEGYQEKSVEITVDSAPQTVTSKIRLDGFFDLTITVENIADGSPVTGASVVIGSDEVITDEDGIAVFERMPADDYSVAITADTYTPKTQSVTVSSDDSITIQLTAL